MAASRRIVLAGLLGALILVVGAILFEVIPTIFFAITVSYVLVPFSRFLRRSGLSRWWASVTATILMFATAIVAVSPIGIVLYLRRVEIIGFLQSLPPTITLEYAEFVYVVDISEVSQVLTEYLTQFAVDTARAAPVLGAKATVFVFVVFALLLRHQDLNRAILAPIPRSYHDIMHAIHDRVKSTLFALYVIQVATAVGTFIIALPLFWLLGYQFPITLAVLAGILQFLPIVGPSFLVIAVTVYELSVGAYTQALLIFFVGIVLISILPDVILRPRLARETARLPGSLYFVGFIGGILSLGPIGIIAGPLIVSVLSLILSLLAAEMNNTKITDFNQ